VQTLLDDGPGSAGLQVKHVLCVPGQWRNANVEVRTLRVGHGIKMLLPHWILLVMNQKERDWHRRGVGEAALTQGGVIHGSVGLRGITTLTSHLSWPWAIDM
jgi:hypothetical protein